MRGSVSTSSPSFSLFFDIVGDDGAAERPTAVARGRRPTVGMRVRTSNIFQSRTHGKDGGQRVEAGQGEDDGRHPRPGSSENPQERINQRAFRRHGSDSRLTALSLYTLHSFIYSLEHQVSDI